MTTTENPVIHTVQDGVMTVTLNRPERRNAMDAAGWVSLFDTIRLASYDDVRVVVLAGAGRTFCSGADISGVPVGHPLTRVRNISRTADALRNLAKPVIAKVEGAAVGAGWNMALCCDLVVAADDARFSQIFAHRALTPDFGGTWLLPRIAGLQQAKRLAFLGEKVTAEEAHRLGLVTWVRPAAEIDEFVAELASRVAAMPPVAIAQAKELLNAGVGQSFGDTLAAEARAQAVNYATEDAIVARRAFSEGTDPTFTGRWSVT